jgi:hypothetical protein
MLHSPSRCSAVILMTGFALLFFASPALAVDGVLEINQTCAVQTGCFSGDSAGFPVTISASGSYRLTGNLSVPDANTTAIEVIRLSFEERNVTPVSIDLGGFALIGPTRCDSGGDAVTCAPTGNGRGIDGRWRIDLGGGSGIAGSSNQMHIHDGSVIGMGNVGISVGNSSTVERVSVSQNGSLGINAGASSLLRDNIVRTNAAIGIRTASDCSVIGNVVGANGGDGINGGGLILRNEIAFNVGFGLHCLGNPDDGYGHNVFRSNQAGTITAGCADMGGNVCNGSLTCP